jgi:hypothetical protein
MANARFHSNGVDLMIDALSAAGETPGDIRERLWQIAYARGHSDVMIPVQIPDVKIEGFCVLSHQFSERRTMVVIDDGSQLIGVIDDLPPPPNGSKLRVLPLYGSAAHWTVKVIAELGCGLSIRFDNDHADSRWNQRLKAALESIRDDEAAIRRQIDIDRRNIEFVLPPEPFRVELERADKEIRDRVTSGGYTAEEQRRLARAKNNQAEADKVVERRNKRLIEAYREETIAFRAKMPELRAEYDRRMDAYNTYRNAVDRCNEVDGASRSVTEGSLRATHQLEMIEQAELNVHATGLERIEENPRRYYAEIIQTVDLLFELLPKRLQKAAASIAR